MTKITEANVDKLANEQEKELLKQLKEGPQTLIHIPEDPANPKDTSVPIGINGLFYQVQRGIDVQVPVPVAEIWRDSYMRTRIANDKIERSTTQEVKVM